LYRESLRHLWREKKGMEKQEDASIPGKSRKRLVESQEVFARKWGLGEPAGVRRQLPRDGRDGRGKDPSVISKPRR